MKPQEKEEQLLESLGRFSSAIVAFSGGVDSSYLAFMAQRAMGQGAHAVTALSPSVSRLQRRMALEFAAAHGLNHTLVESREMEDERYLSNPANRCYFCKSELYGQLEGLRRQWEVEVILDGANLDDRSDYRPGHRAARQGGVLSPLAEAGLTKRDIRQLSRKWQLETWDKPAMPCLSSRFPYGTPITPQALSQVDRAEDYLRSLGLKNFRVRHHGNLARLEVASEEMAALLDLEVMHTIHERLREIGYLQVTLDMKGFRSGSLNEGLQKERSQESGVRNQEEWGRGGRRQASGRS